MLRHPDSHVDHVPPVVLDYVLKRFADRETPFTETFQLPPGLPLLGNALYGPTCGDPPVPESDVYYAARPGRDYPSRLTRKPIRMTRLCTVIAGPHAGQPCVLFTVFGGPVSPREPGDAAVKPEDIAASQAFWSRHALATALEAT